MYDLIWVGWKLPFAPLSSGPKYLVTSLSSWLRGVKSSAAQVAEIVRSGEGALELSLVFWGKREQLSLVSGGKKVSKAWETVKWKTHWGFLRHSYGASPEAISIWDGRGGKGTPDPGALLGRKLIFCLHKELWYLTNSQFFSLIWLLLLFSV